MRSVSEHGIEWRIGSLRVLHGERVNVTNSAHDRRNEGIEAGLLGLFAHANEGNQFTRCQQDVDDRLHLIVNTSRIV